ncbi:MAG: ribosome-associated translation inhibitor RaiA [Gammaproteobacteria bacterium]|nr:ribosome-associated translation inhibitor RaiA [Gammaproteobacteria bacterium]
MKIDLSGHHVDITDSLRAYVDEKIGRVEKHFDRVTDVHVVLSVEKQAQKAEATIHVKGNKIFAHAENADMYAAIDSLTDKLDRQIIKHKEKITNHRSKPVRIDDTEKSDTDLDLDDDLNNDLGKY